MRRTRLSDVCEISSGGTPSRNHPEFFKGGILWAKISDLESAAGGIVNSTEEHISGEGLKSIRGKLFPRGTLLFAMYGSIGKTGIAGKALATNQAILGIRPKNEDEIDLRYLRFWFAQNKLRLINQGQGVALKNLSATIIRNLELDLPPLGDQIRIAHLLGKVEGLIAQRKHHLQQLDDLLKSVFQEMFGDPVRNEKGWETGSLSKYGSFKNGLNFGKGESGAKVRYLGVGDFKALAKLNDIGGLSYIELNSLPGDDYFLRDGDLLFVRSNGNRELVGRCMAVYPGAERVTYSGFCIRYRVHGQRLQSTYISHLFRSTAFRRTLFQGGQGANIQNINQQALSGISIPLPPEDLQSRFAATVKAVEDLNGRYQQNLTDLESLYGALSLMAFKGELDLSHVPLPDSEQPVPQVAVPDAAPSPAGLPNGIHLPDTDLLLAALEDHARLKELIPFWLDAYRTQLDGAVFSAQAFLTDAQARIAELHPDNDLELDINAYEQVKTWVFEALDSGRLTQGYADADNRVTLANRSPDWGT